MTGLKELLGLPDIIKKLDAINDIDALSQLNKYLVERINFIRNCKGFDIKSQLRIGSQVKIQIKHCRNSGDVLYNKIGTVVKINPSRARIQFEQGTWNVSYGFIEIVE